VDYGSIVFVEEWTHDQWERTLVISADLRQEKIGNMRSKERFSSEHGFARLLLWDRWQPNLAYHQPAVRDSEWKDFYPPQIPLLGHGLKPYLTPAHAVNDWVFGSTILRAWAMSSESMVLGDSFCPICARR